MKRKEFIDRLKEIKLVAHRLGYKMTPYPENSLESLRYIFENKELLDSCSGFEFDICFTKDNIPIITHDKYIDDITDKSGLIKNYTLNELKKINFTFRKTNKTNNNSITYKIATLEEILSFFKDNISLLNNKLIKIETKDYIFAAKSNLNTKNLKILANIINKFPMLSNNIVHLSFWPINLFFLKKIQKKNKYQIIKNDLLCDYNIIIFFTKFIFSIDSISLRIRAKSLPYLNENNNKRVNKKIKSDLFWMNFSNVIKEKNLKYAIKKYGKVGLYTLNNSDEIDEICKHISTNFFMENFKDIIITTNNPIYLRKLQ